MNVHTVPQLQIWALITVLGVVGGMAIAVIRWGVMRIIKSVDAIQRDLHMLSMNMASHDQRIQTLHEMDNNITARLNDHSTRMRTVETDIAILKNKRE